MCFSAVASFSAGILLTGIGVAAIREVKTSAVLPLAIIPVLFGVQQIIEGILWLSLMNPEWAEYQNVSTFGFLLIAQVIWPVWLPASFMMYEKNPKRKKIIKLFLFTGILVAVYFLYCMLTFSMDASLQHRHILYDLSFPKKLVPVMAFLYVMSTVTSGLISTSPKVKLIGLIILIFYIVSRILFQPNLISIWCYFASVISILAYIIIHDERKSERMAGVTV